MNNMKKLMIASAMAAVAFAVTADVTSNNIVGYNNTKVSVNARRMSTAQFLNIGGDPAKMTIEAFAQNSGEWTDSFLVLYNDNVQSVSDNLFFLSEEMIKTYELDPELYKPGWYFCDKETMPDLERGVQKLPLPYLQGCVICGAAMDGVDLTSSGEVATDSYEIVIPVNARRMTGNPLPRTIDINEIEQIGGEWTDSFLVTYNDNVQSTRENLFCLTADMIKNYELDPNLYKPGWYFCDKDTMPDLERGIQHISFEPGEGFVICGAAMDGVTIRFPKAIPDAE